MNPYFYYYFSANTRNRRGYDNYPRGGGGGQGYPSASYGAPTTGFQGYSYNRPPNQLTYPQYPGQQPILERYDLKLKLYC